MKTAERTRIAFQRGTPEPWMFVVLCGLGSVLGLLMTGFACWMDVGRSIVACAGTVGGRS